MIQLEKQCYHIQNVIYGQHNKHVFDKVSDAEDETSSPTTIMQQHITQTANSDINSIDKAYSIETQVRDQLTSNI